jgi:hypothetical protein
MSATSGFILVHSPLMGAVTWSWVAGELRDRGHDVVVPSLKRAATSGSWQRCVDAVLGDAPADPAALVGHSGAGPLLPVIASRMHHPPERLVFVDATVPPRRGEARLAPPEFLDSLRALALGETLPPWSEWFDPGTMEALVADEERRDAVLDDLPELPLSYFEERVPMPTGWADTDGAHVLLSDAYRPDAAEARSRGWPVAELPGQHLDIVTRAADVATAILDFCWV